MAMQSQRGCSEFSSGSRLPIRNSLVLLGVLCFTLMACGGPDYTKPGHTGEKPTKDILTSYSISINTPLALAHGMRPSLQDYRQG